MRNILYLFLLLLPGTAFSQQRFIVFYADKGTDVATYYSSPETVLGKVAAAKRAKAGIPVDYHDLPVLNSYNKFLYENDIKILRTSKWLNAALIETNLSIEKIAALSPVITRVIPAGDIKKNQPVKFSNSQSDNGNDDQNNALKGTALNYGLAGTQNRLLGIDCLHDRGYTGAGVTVAFFDCGFPALDTLDIYDSLWQQSRIKGTYDFWGDTSFVYYKNNHGTHCASEVFASKPGIYIGMAPSANAIFAITDDYDTETPQDEFNYVAALEWADSLGADIISASISYKDFDDPAYNYAYAAMNGRTAISTLGCNIAAAKGLLIVNGAGNSGYICAPCDADSILCVGGANNLRNYDLISSRGPSYDGRIKPDVAAQTINVYGMNTAGTPQRFNYGGTSSATPQIAGLAICLKQAHPSATNVEIINAIRKSAHHAQSPDSLTGYGVPDACKADSILSRVLDVRQAAGSKAALRIFPNPANSMLYLESAELIQSVEVISLVGQQVKQQVIRSKSAAIGIRELPAATYLIRAHYPGGRASSLKFVKE